MRFLGTIFLLLALSGLYGQTLKPYSTLTREYHPQSWLKKGERALDGDSILIQKKNFHPLNVSIWAILSYDTYLQTGDSMWYRRFARQYRYFQSPSHAEPSDSGKGLKLPYRFTFKNLKAPWYSGMANGAALSYLVRYFTATGDSTALEKAQKLCYNMCQPVAKGGAMAKNREGLTWIEEYPSDPGKLQVINGGIVSLIGLYEYLQFCPNDTLARRTHDDFLQSIIKGFPLYDTPKWTTYSRGGVQLSPEYLRLQIAQAEHLYELYRMDTFLLQQMIWSRMYASTPEKKPNFYRNNAYLPGLELVKGKDHAARVAPVSLHSRMRQDMDSLSGIHPTHLRLDHPSTLVYFQYTGNLGVTGVKVKALSRTGANVVAQVIREPKGFFVVGEDSIVSLTLKYTNAGKNNPPLATVATYSRDTLGAPAILFASLPKGYSLKQGESFQLHHGLTHIPEAWVFYRNAQKTGDVSKVNWMITKTRRCENGIFVAPETGFYEFFIAFPYLAPNPMIHGLHD